MSEPETSPSAPPVRRSSSIGRAAWDEYLAAVERIRQSVAEREMADLTENTNPTPLQYYEWNEWGTWGYCDGCQREITLGEDGFLVDHEFPGRGTCTYSGRRPGTQPSPEVTVKMYPHPPPDEDGND